jgi:hypothetical protein
MSLNVVATKLKHAHKVSTKLKHALKAATKLKHALKAAIKLKHALKAATKLKHALKAATKLKHALKALLIRYAYVTGTFFILYSYFTLLILYSLLFRYPRETHSNSQRARHIQRRRLRRIGLPLLSSPCASCPRLQCTDALLALLALLEMRY